MRKRWNISERLIPSLNSYRIFSPDDELRIHDLLDLVTKTILHHRHIDPHIRYTVGHGMALLGLENLKMTQVWLDPKADDKACRDSLCAADVIQDEVILGTIWSYRHRLALLPESWRHVLEGHPILGSLRYNPNRLEMASIADGIIGTARRSVDTIREIDNLILKIWGCTEPLPKKTMQDLANRYPQVLELNGWYSYEDFGLSPKS